MFYSNGSIIVLLPVIYPGAGTRRYGRQNNTNTAKNIYFLVISFALCAQELIFYGY